MPQQLEPLSPMIPPSPSSPSPSTAPPHAQSSLPLHPALANLPSPSEPSTTRVRPIFDRQDPSPPPRWTDNVCRRLFPRPKHVKNRDMTRDERLEIRLLYQRGGGWTQKKIAEVLGIKRGAVQYALAQEHLTPQKRKKHRMQKRRDAAAATTIPTKFTTV